MHASPRSLLQGWLLRYGVANFFEQGVYGPIGCGGLSSIKDRQYEHHTSLSPELLDCFSILESIIQSRPERLFPIVARLFVPLLTLLWISPELVQVLFALMARPAQFRGRRGIWFIDNIAALMSLIRGRSPVDDLERLSHLTQAHFSPSRFGFGGSGCQVNLIGLMLSADSGLMTPGSARSSFCCTGLSWSASSCLPFPAVLTPLVSFKALGS